MSETIHIAIPADGADYRRWAEVTAQSATEGSSLPVEVHYLDWTVLDERRFARYAKWHGSAIAWSRLFLAELFPDLDWVISCDADVLFRGDVAQLWKLRDDAVSIVASEDHPFPGEPLMRLPFRWYAEKGLCFVDPRLYFCDGLCLCNLKRWRMLGLQTKFVELADRFDDWPSPDQMILNYVLQADAKKLPLQWGCFSGDANLEVDYNGDCAIHFVSDVPWKRTKPTQLLSDAVVLWRQAAGLPIGGWRRWLYLALGKTWGFWRHVPWVSAHYRNAGRVR